MAEPIIYMRGFPAQFAQRPSESPGMMEDLSTVAQLSDDQVDVIVERLTTAKGFLDPKSLLKLCSDSIGDESQAESLQRVVRFLRPESVESLIQALDDDKKEPEFPFDDGQLVRLKQILTRLISNFPALKNFEKAERLSKLTGNQLETAEIICDIRPIFDEDRERIEGMMPYTRLRLLVTGADGLPISFEAEVTYQQVQDLLDKSQKAISKLGVLRETILEWVPAGLPELPLTRVPSKESKDA